MRLCRAVANFNAMTQEIIDILESNGFERVFAMDSFIHMAIKDNKSITTVVFDTDDSGNQCFGIQTFINDNFVSEEIMTEAEWVEAIKNF